MHLLCKQDYTFYWTLIIDQKLVKQSYTWVGLSSPGHIHCRSIGQVLASDIIRSVGLSNINQMIAVQSDIQCNL